MFTDEFEIVFDLIQGPHFWHFDFGYFYYAILVHAVKMHEAVVLLDDDQILTQNMKVFCVETPLEIFSIIL
jgi:hypothetical protein